MKNKMLHLCFEGALTLNVPSLDLPALSKVTTVEDKDMYVRRAAWAGDGQQSDSVLMFPNIW